ncbi:MAG TPA: PrsW family intramembrane metalloprotease [Thermoplasmata archaeon]|nr:PrsW family intramembrane metalloprotease [Thermoplasmata archaeon]
MYHYVPRYGREDLTLGIPRRLVLIALVLGALAGGIAGFVNSIYGIGVLFLVKFDLFWFIVLLVGVVAPVVEELVKLLGVYLINQEEWPNLAIRDWTVLGALSGLGFATLENAIYALNFLAAGFGGDATLLLLGIRFLFPLHIISTAVAATGFGLWVRTGEIGYFLRYVGVAMLLHASFNLTMVLL